MESFPASVPAFFPRVPREKLFSDPLAVSDRFPIQPVQVDFERLIAKRDQVLATVDAMPAYLLKPEVLGLLRAEPDPVYRLVMELMWMTGGRISEILGLTRESLVDDGYDVSLRLKTLKSRPGRPSKKSLTRSPVRYVSLHEEATLQRLQGHLYRGHFKAGERIFPMSRQHVNRRIHQAVERVGGAPFPISAHTFRHSFAVHVLLHGRPLKIISQLLGHASIQSTEIYTNVLSVDASQFLEGVRFH